MNEFICRLTVTAVLIGVVSGCVVNHQPANTIDAVSSSLDDDFALFQQWFPGEYDNHEQVWQQKVNGLKGKELHEHIHHIFKPVSANNIGNNVYFVKQYSNGDYESVYRQRLYHFTKNKNENAIQLTIYSFKDQPKYRYVDRNPELIKNITKDELKTTSGCEVYWKYNGQYFDGFMKEKACHFYSERSKKKIYITDTLRLTHSEIHIGDKAFDEQGNKIFGRDEQHINRKVRFFKGWMGIQKNKIDPEAGSKEWVFVKEFTIHNEGQTVALTDKDGSKTGYSVKLEQLTYQNTSQPILKLGVIDDASGKTITYIWSEVDSVRIGMNLRWLQVGLTAVDSQ